MRDRFKAPLLLRAKQNDDTQGSPSVSLSRMTAAAARVVASRKELQVEFAPGALRLEENLARIPPPPQTLSRYDVMRVRGQADALALRRKHQNPHIHAVAKSLPQPAREIFAVLEQARCEALGAGGLTGVEQNIQAALDHQYRSQGWGRRDRVELTPLPEILSLLAREAMTGCAPPRSAAGVLTLWRPRLWPRIGVHLTEMAAALSDPQAFTRIALALLATLDVSIEADAEGEMLCSLEGYRRVTDGNEEDASVDEGTGGSKPPPRPMRLLTLRSAAPKAYLMTERMRSHRLLTVMAHTTKNWRPAHQNRLVLRTHAYSLMLYLIGLGTRSLTKSSMRKNCAAKRSCRDCDQNWTSYSVRCAVW